MSSAPAQKQKRVNLGHFLYRREEGGVLTPIPLVCGHTGKTNESYIKIIDPAQASWI